MADKPNIVFILADDMGCGDLGCFGNPDIELPHLDEMATEGAVLTQHYSGSCMCAPARAALLTGRYPHRTGAIDVVEVRGLDRIALSETTIADLFSAAGYATGCIGKWHNGAIDRRYHPLQRGFDEFVGFCAGLVTSYWEWTVERNGRYEKGDGEYLTGVFTQAAVEFIDRHSDEPFFLYVPYNAPHTPWQAPEEDIQHFRDMNAFSEAVCTIYGMNRRMDSGVGRIMRALQRNGIEENTIVVFTSDNGPVLARRGAQRYNCEFNGEKGDVLEGGIRVPCIVRWPAGIESGRQISQMTHFVDWLPTLLHAAGLDTPADLSLDGRSMVGLLRGEHGERARKRFWQWNRYEPVADCNAAMRDGPWKLYRPPIPEAMEKLPIDSERTRRLVENPREITDIWTEPEIVRDPSEPGRPRLFNLDEDPGERHDIAADHPGRTARMQSELREWFARMERERPTDTQ